MEKVYQIAERQLILREGNIADYDGGAIAAIDTTDIIDPANNNPNIPLHQDEQYERIFQSMRDMQK